MSEIAVVSSRKSKLEAKSKQGNHQADNILKIKEDPDKFLSTIQIAITTIGLIIGLYTGEQYVSKLALLLEKININSSVAPILSRVAIVLAETYVMLVIGELIPKRLGMANPETIAYVIVKPMKILSKIVFPFVWLLSKTTNALLTLMNFKQKENNNATEDEIKSIIEESADAGEIKKREQKILNSVFDLDDRGIVSLMTPRADLEWFKKDDKISDVIAKITDDIHYMYPVVENNLDDIIGVIYLKDILKASCKSSATVADYMQEPNFIHESVGVYDVLEMFRRTNVGYTFVIDEFGFVQGMVTMNDIADALIDNSFDLHEANDGQEFIKQENGKYIVDGQYSFYDLLSHLDMKDKLSLYNYTTVSGLILAQTGRPPKKGDKIAWENLVFEIMDVEGVRIDKVLVTDNKQTRPR